MVIYDVYTHVNWRDCYVIIYIFFIYVGPSIQELPVWFGSSLDIVVTRMSVVLWAVNIIHNNVFFLCANCESVYIFINCRDITMYLLFIRNHMKLYSLAYHGKRVPRARRVFFSWEFANLPPTITGLSTTNHNLTIY